MGHWTKCNPHGKDYYNTFSECEVPGTFTNHAFTTQSRNLNFMNKSWKQSILSDKSPTNPMNFDNSGKASDHNWKHFSPILIDLRKKMMDFSDCDRDRHGIVIRRGPWNTFDFFDSNTCARKCRVSSLFTCVQSKNNTWKCDLHDKWRDGHATIDGQSIKKYFVNSSSDNVSLQQVRECKGFGGVGKFWTPQYSCVNKGPPIKVGTPGAYHYLGNDVEFGSISDTDCLRYCPKGSFAYDKSPYGNDGAYGCVKAGTLRCLKYSDKMTKDQLTKCLQIQQDPDSTDATNTWFNYTT